MLVFYTKLNALHLAKTTSKQTIHTIVKHQLNYSMQHVTFRDLICIAATISNWYQLNYTNCQVTVRDLISIAATLTTGNQLNYTNCQVTFQDLITIAATITTVYQLK